MGGVSGWGLGAVWVPGSSAAAGIIAWRPPYRGVTSSATRENRVPLLKRKPEEFDLRVEDLLFRVTAPEDYYEESRAAAMSFWEQIQSYGIRNPRFRSSKGPIQVPEDAPEIVREMAEAAARAGVGPAFTLQGAMTEHVGRFLSTTLAEVQVSAAGDHYVRSRRRVKLPVFHDTEGGGLSVLVEPVEGSQGMYTTLGRRQLPAETVDGLAVLAETCILADAAAAAVMGILVRPGRFKQALAFLQDLEGVRGGVVVQGDRIGVVGGLELVA